MSDETKMRSPGMKRWLRVLLVVSLAFNLLVLGVVGGAMMKWSKWRSHYPPRLEMAGGPLTRALSREDRRAIGRQMRDAYKEGGTSHAQMRAELEGLVNDLKAEPFEPERVSARFLRHREGFHERFELGQKLLLERLTQMQPEERAAYADRLLDALKNHGRYRHDKDRRKEYSD